MGDEPKDETQKEVVNCKRQLGVGRGGEVNYYELKWSGN